MFKNSTIFYALLLVGSILFLANSSGAPVGRSGAPGDNTCGTSSCHSVSANVESATVAINFQEGLEVYQAGETYRLEITIEGAQNEDRNGFQIVALDANNENIGEWILTETDETQLRSSNATGRQYVTHTRDGNDESDWEMDWIAPETDAGDITFYASVLDANGNGGRSGDHLYTLSQTLTFDVQSSVRNMQEAAITVFPNPACDQLLILSDNLAIQTYALYNSEGKLLQRDSYQQTLDISRLPNGLYFLQLFTVEGILHRKVVVER